LKIEAQVEGTSTAYELSSYANFGQQPSSVELTGTGGSYFLTHAVTALRVKLIGTYPRPSLTTAWLAVSDPGVLPATLSFEVNSLFRTPGGDLEYDANAFANAVAFPLRTCAPGKSCTLYLEAQVFGSTATYALSSYDDFAQNPSFQQMKGTAPQFFRNRIVTALRIRLSSGYPRPTLVLPWIPVSENISGGHDLDAGLALVVAAFGSKPPLEACLSMFPAGTHTQGSSLNDPQLSCLEATQGGQSISTFAASYIKTLSAKQVTALLVAAGLATRAATAAVSPDLDYGRPLPAGCQWVGVAKIRCAWGGSTIDYRPISAPPEQDPVWGNNVQTDAQKQRQTTQQPPSVIPAPGPVPGPLDYATQGELDKLLREQCEEYAAEWGGAAGLAEEDDCDDIPIFGTGIDVLEATLHDLSAIASNPRWFLLHHVSNQEKNSAGFYRPTWVCDKGAGQQCDEYPFFATAEGYPAPPNVVAIDASDNLSQGQKYGVFVRYCPRIRDAPLGSEDRRFLVVPLPFLPTVTYCPAGSL
jgi:hypothetical protein